MTNQMTKNNNNNIILMQIVSWEQNSDSQSFVN